MLISNATTCSYLLSSAQLFQMSNIYDTGSAFIFSATGFFSPKFRVGEGTEVCQCVYIFFQRYGLSGVGSGEGKGGGGHNILTQL